MDERRTQLADSLSMKNLTAYAYSYVLLSTSQENQGITKWTITVISKSSVCARKSILKYAREALNHEVANHSLRLVGAVPYRGNLKYGDISDIVSSVVINGR